ncbi:hypothetical protein TNCV_94951 [Trichonephila clavipes]|nr:hypothetical protein TNCV_94951 [Trichonephila clavipes]
MQFWSPVTGAILVLASVLNPSESLSHDALVPEKGFPSLHISHPKGNKITPLQLRLNRRGVEEKQVCVNESTEVRIQEIRMLGFGRFFSLMAALGFKSEI